MTTERVYIGIGANLGDAIAQVRAAANALGALPETRLVQTSSLYRSAPLGYADQPDFINAVAALDTALAPHALLDALHAIEQAHGRTRSFKDAPRTLDLDVLLYGTRIIDDATLRVPHPRLHERAFALAPLAEIAPDCTIPGCGKVTTLLARCTGQTIARL